MEVIIVALGAVFFALALAMCVLAILIADWRIFCLAIVLVAATFVAAHDLQLQEDSDKRLQAQHLNSLGFQKVIVLDKDKADVSLSVECHRKRIFLYMRKNDWFVGTEAIQSAKPVADANELANRSAVRRWCSSAPIEN